MIRYLVSAVATNKTVPTWVLVAVLSWMSYEITTIKEKLVQIQESVITVKSDLRAHELATMFTKSESRNN